MDYRDQEIKAGLMVILCAVILVAFLVAISGVKLLKSYKEYRVRLKYTGGIEVGSLVRYGGMEVGKVTKIEIPEDENTTIELTLRVDEKTPIKVDSEAYITSIGILGDFYVEVTPGTPGAKLLPSASRLKGREVSQLMQLTQPLAEISDKLQELIDRVNDILNQDSRNHVASMISHLDKLMIENYGNFSATAANLKELSDKLQKIASKLDRMFAAGDSVLPRTVNNLDETLQQSQTLLENMDRTLNNLNRMVLAREGNLVEIMESMETTSRNLEQFSRIIKERPWNLVRKETPQARKIPVP